MKDAIITAVRQTTNYSKFKTLKGNREVQNNRKTKIADSINEHGQLFSPIIVNEKMEIIDGQGRFEVLKDMGGPVQYIVSPGLRLKDCIVLNSTSTKWSNTDYVNSYIEQGNTNYFRLKKLLQDHSSVPHDSVIYACFGRRVDGRIHKAWISGKLILSEETAKNAEAKLSYAERFIPGFKNGSASGRTTHFLNAVMFCFGYSGIQNHKLLEKWNKYCGTDKLTRSIASVRDGVQMLESIYNYKTPVNSVAYPVAAFDQYTREKTSLSSVKKEVAQ